MKKVPIIIGPTAVGKSEIAFEIAFKNKMQIISCDSRQVYRFMDIGTAKPSLEQRKLVKHYMIGIVNPDENYTAWDYAKKARKIINEAKKPLVVGGSGLYLRALTDGFFQIPKPDKKIRERLMKTNKDELYGRLKKVDPESKIHKNDVQRIIRALEVYEATKIPISEWQRLRIPASFTPTYIGIKIDREKLYERIEKRADKMMENGFLDEVKNILKMGFSPSLNSLQTIGYKELIDYINGKIGLQDAINLIKCNTKNYARRQLTWFRKIKNVQWMAKEDLLNRF
jgi:tRNA dimethylallyltransferase